MVQAGADDGRLDVLFPGCVGTLDRDLLQKAKPGERVVPDSVKWTVGGPRMMASNNWAVAAQRSATGHALLANDLHLEVNRLTFVWVEQVIGFPDNTVFTANMPGLGGPQVGRKDDLAWATTYAFMDAVDSWVEECCDGEFRREDRFESFTERREQIVVKKSEPVDVVFYENLHGELDGDPFEAGFYLATRWAPADWGAATPNAVTDISGARTVEDAQGAFGRVETAWNWVFADSSGRIGYQMSGQLPIRDEDATGFVPMPGWDPKWDLRRFVAPEELPGVLDPPEGFIVTANNDLNHLGVANPINMPMGDYRARRITSLLSEEVADLDTFRRIHQDTYSLQAEEMMSLLAPLLPGTRIGHVSARGISVASLTRRERCFSKAFYRELLVEMFAPDGMGQPVVDHLVDATRVFIDFYHNFDRVDSAEDRRWGDVNRVTLAHLLLGGKLPEWAGFDVGPIEIKGGRVTPHQGQIYESAGRTTSFAPSLRLMVDMGQPGLRTALARGPSARRFSKWYTSDLERRQRGEYKDLRRLDEPPD
jgi:penicillin amidase